MLLLSFCGSKITVMSDEPTVYDEAIQTLLHPVDLIGLKEAPHRFSQSRYDLVARERTFKSFVSSSLDKTGYSRLSRGVGLFVSLYHTMTEQELGIINTAKEHLQDELFDIVNGLVGSSTVIELNKLRLRRTGLTALLRQTYQESITAAEATIEHDEKNLSKALEHIGLLAGIVEEER